MYGCSTRARALLARGPGSAVGLAGRGRITHTSVVYPRRDFARRYTNNAVQASQTEAWLSAVRIQQTAARGEDGEDSIEAGSW